MFSLRTLSVVASAVALATSAGAHKQTLSKRSYIGFMTMKSVFNKFIAAQDYFDYSMRLADERYDPSYNYIWYNDNGPWSTRFTAWYIPGLLHRNKGDDVARAQKALRNL